MNIVIEAKDILLILIGVVGSVVANHISKHLDASNSATQRLIEDLRSSEVAVASQAQKRCLFKAARLYIFANIFWVVSGVAWIFGGIEYGISAFLLAGSSLTAILLFWLALKWLQRAQPTNGA